MIKLSATQIDAYLKYLNDAISEEMLIGTLLRTGESNLKMELGIEFHSLLENHSKHSNIFDMQQINQVRSKFNKGVNEIKTRIVYPAKQSNVVITGMADNITGTIVNEYKTTWGTFNIDKYIESIQWQLYCRMFGAHAVNYAVFEFYLSSTIKTFDDIHEPLKFKELHEFKLYSDMVDDKHIDNAINGLTDYVYFKNLQQHMQADIDAVEFNVIH